jgi:hypothetical protein
VRVLALVLFLAALATSCRSKRPTEFINITFTPSVDTSHWETFAFDFDRIEEADHQDLDTPFLRDRMLAELEVELTGLGYERGEPADADFIVWYRFELTGEVAVASDGVRVAPMRGLIYLADVRTGRFVWRGERRARVAALETDEERAEAVRAFVREVVEQSERLAGR